MGKQENIEESGRYRWENIPEDPIMSRISVHVYCAYRMEFGREWRRGYVRNHYDRLYFIESGEATVSTPEQEVVLRPGHCYLLGANLLHRHSCPAAITMHWCHFQTLLDGSVDLFQEIAVPLEARPGSLSSYRNIFQSLGKTMDCRNACCHLLRASLLLQLIQPHLKLADPASRRIAEGRRRFLPVLKHIDAHLHETIRIADLAGLLGLNREYFSRFFRKHFRVPPKRYILQKRIQHAQKLLCQTGLQIQEIGGRCGFPDPYHFSKTFRNTAGIPPSEYRQRYQKQSISPFAA